MLAELIEQRRQTVPKRSRQTIISELEQSADHLKAAEARLDELVIEARDAGATWEEIGRALGVTTQTAHRRYSPDALQKELDRQARLRRRSS